MSVRQEAATSGEELEVRIDQDLCTGDGVCVRYAPEIFEPDIDAPAYVKGPQEEFLQVGGGAARVPSPLVRDVVDSARECPGECIQVRRFSDRVEVFGPDAE